jgi:hypothetical protein
MYTSAQVHGLKLVQLQGTDRLFPLGYAAESEIKAMISSGHSRAISADREAKIAGWLQQVKKRLPKFGLPEADVVAVQE